MHPYYRRRRLFIEFLYNFMTRRACRLHPESSSSLKENCNKMMPGILERLPYIGGRRNAHTPIMIINGWFVLIYKAMETEGFSEPEIQKTIYNVTENLINKVPLFAGRIIKGIFFTSRIRKFLGKQASRSQKELYECDFKFTVDYPSWEDNGEREVRFSFERCGVQQYYRMESCPGLSAFCNFADPIYGKRFRLGLDAEHTMAQGYEVCTLSFNNRRETKTPQNIMHIIGKSNN